MNYDMQVSSQEERKRKEEERDNDIIAKVPRKCGVVLCNFLHMQKRALFHHRVRIG
jgi:hypothetical protein